MIIILIFDIMSFAVQYHRKICSKLQLETINAKTLLSESKERENANEKTFLRTITEIEKKQKRMEEEWRLALGDFGSSNSRNRKKQEKSLLELAGLVSGVSKCLGSFGKDLKDLGSRHSEEKKKVTRRSFKNLMN